MLCGSQTMVHIKTWMLISAVNSFLLQPSSKQKVSSEHRTLGLCFYSLCYFGMAGCAITADWKTKPTG